MTRPPTWYESTNTRLNDLEERDLGAMLDVTRDGWLIAQTFALFAVVAMLAALLAVVVL